MFFDCKEIICFFECVYETAESIKRLEKMLNFFPKIAISRPYKCKSKELLRFKCILMLLVGV